VLSDAQSVAIGFIGSIVLPVVLKVDETVPAPVLLALVVGLGSCRGLT
jgi:hypothetical protein